MIDARCERLRVAVVGCGSIATSLHLPAAQNHPDAQLVAVCDRDGERAKAIARAASGVQAFTEFGRMLDEVPVDLVVNATPPCHHASISTAALERGIHVYSEKPIATTLADASSLLATAETSGAQLAVGPEVTLAPVAVALRDARSSVENRHFHSVYGRYSLDVRPDAIAGPSWYYRAEHGGGVLFDLGAYLVTALIWLLGDVRRVTAASVIAVPERRTPLLSVVATAADTATALLEFACGTQAAVQMSFSTANAEGLIVDLLGAEHSISVRGRHWADASVSVDGTTERIRETRPVEQRSGVYETITSLRAGSIVSMSARRAFHSLEVLIAAATAAREHCVVEVSSS